MTTSRSSHEDNWRSERGEAFSWLVLIIGLIAATAFAATMVGPMVGGLVDRIDNAADSEQIVPAGGESEHEDDHDHDHDHDHDQSGADDDEPVEVPTELEDGTPVSAELTATRDEVIDILEAGNDDKLTEDEVQDLQDLLEGLTSEELAWLWDSLTDEQRDRLLKNFLKHDPSDAEVAAFLDIFDGVSDYPLEVIGRDDPVASGYNDALAEAYALGEADPWLRVALTTLVTSDGFDELDYHQRTALLSQFTNYPDATAIGNLIALVETESFREMGMADAQRAAKTVGFLSTYEPEGGDTTVTDNTLELILSGEIPIDFEATSGYGSASTDGVIHINPEYIPDGHDPISDTDTDAHRVLTHTVAHEVNHVLNGDRVDDTFEYFMGEYRAYYAGQTARYGRPPTRAEVERRLLGLLNVPWIPEDQLADGERRRAYSYLDKALADPVEGPKIAEFVSEAIGREVTVENVVDELKAGSTDPDEQATTPISVDEGPNNLTNEPGS